MRHRPELVKCLECGEELLAPVWQQRRFCSRSCANGFLKFRRAHQIRLLPSRHPTTQQIAWAAGVYEGEGSASATRTKNKPWIGIVVSVSQKDSWLVTELRSLFGGSVYKRSNRNCFDWTICGALGRGFLMTIYKFLSPRRQSQIRRAIGVKEAA